MRRIVACLAAVTASAVHPGVARGDHGDPWLVASPDPSEGLPVNGRITLFAVNGPHPAVVEHRSLSYRLVADSETVPLRASDLRRGDDWNGYGVSSILLTPRRRLSPSTRYRLEVRAAGEPWSPLYVAAILMGPTVIYGGPAGGAEWTTGSTADRGAPLWTGPPAAVPGHYGELNIAVPVGDETPVTFRVLAVPSAGRVVRERTFHHGVFGVQDGCCYVPLSEDRYRVTLVPVDSAGNAGPPRTIRLDTRGHDFQGICLRPPSSDEASGSP